MYYKLVFTLLYFATMVAAKIDATTEQNKIIAKPECMLHEFSQKSKLFGNLERKAGNKGKLTFKEEPTEVLHIFFCIHPRKVDSPGYDTYDVPSASSLSLARSLDHMDEAMRNRTTVSIFLNSHNEGEFFALYNWTKSLFQNRSLFTMIYKCPNGNMASYNCMVDTLFRHHKEGLVEKEDVIYFIEDDYLHQPEATRELVDIFASHNPCFATPYDFADRYFMPDFNDDDGKITIIAGKERNWRTTYSTTVTFSARFATLEYFFSLNMVPHPEDDYLAALAIAKSGASIVSPIPSLSAHIESYGDYLSHRAGALDSHEYVSLYHDWFGEAARLLEIVKGMEWNLWTLVAHYKSTSENRDDSSRDDNYNLSAELR